MEVRIKDNNGYVDADWTIEDGVMVVSPKEVMFEPKDGDILIGGNRSKDAGNYWIFILKGEIKDEFDGCIFANEYASVEKSGSLEIDSYSDSMKWFRPATEDEKKKLFNKLTEKGYEWDAEKKEVVKIKWKPKCDENYYAPWIDVSNSDKFFCDHLYWDNDPIDEELYDRGWCFKTEEDCQSFCDKLNQAIKSVKP